MPETILINVTLSILVHLPSEFELLQTANCLIDDVADIFHHSQDCRNYG